jgi:hypothetical protein
MLLLILIDFVDEITGAVTAALYLPLILFLE